MHANWRLSRKFPCRTRETTCCYHKSIFYTGHDAGANQPLDVCNAQSSLRSEFLDNYGGSLSGIKMQQNIKAPISSCG